MHVTAAVCGAGTAALSETVIGTVDGPMIDADAGVTVVIVGGFTVNVAERV